MGYGVNASLVVMADCRVSTLLSLSAVCKAAMASILINYQRKSIRGAHMSSSIFSAEGLFGYDTQLRWTIGVIYFEFTN